MKKKKEIRLIDKKVLEYVLTEQQEELEVRAEEVLCHRKEETLVDLKSSPCFWTRYRTWRGGTCL